MRPEVFGAAAFAVALATSLLVLPPGGGDETEAASSDDRSDDVPPGFENIQRLSSLSSLSRTSTAFEDVPGEPAPTWDRGDAWFVELGGEACTIAVVEANDSGYQQGTTCEDLAVNDVVYRLVVFGEFDDQLGAIERGDRTTALFAWPLADGRTWRTEWPGRDGEVIVEARAARISGPAGDEDGFVMEVFEEDKDEPFASYDYAPSIKWWSRFEDGISGADLRVVGYRDGFSGDLFMARGELMMERTGGLVHTHDQFVVPPEATHLLGRATVAGPGYYTPTFLAPDGSLQRPTALSATGLGSADSTFTLDTIPGEWTYLPTGVSGGLGNGLSLVVYSIQVTSHVL